MLGKYYNNFFSRINPSFKNKIANFKLINYIKKIAINKNKEIIEEN